MIECYNDEAFLRSIGIQSKKIGHEAGKGKVLRRLFKTKGKIAKIAMIDEDPNSSQPNILERFEQVQSIAGIEVRKNEEKFVLIMPNNLEDYLLTRAKLSKIDIRGYKLPNQAYDLHKITGLSSNYKFNSFLHEVYQSDKELKKLSSWILETLEDT